MEKISKIVHWLVISLSTLVMLVAAESELPRLLLVSLGYVVALIVVWCLGIAGEDK